MVPFFLGPAGAGVWAVTNPTVHALASWRFALWQRQEGAQGTALCTSVRDVRDRALSLPRPPVFRACSRGPLPTGCGCSVRAWGPVIPNVHVALRGLRSMGAAAVRPEERPSLGWAFLGTFSRAAVHCVLCALPRFGHPVAVVAWHLSMCLGCGRRHASLACVMAQHWCAGPPLVRSLLVLRSAFSLSWCLPLPGAFATGFTQRQRGARGGRQKTRLMVPVARPRRSGGAWLARCGTRSGIRYGAVSGGSLRRRSRAACAAVVWRVWPRSFTRPVSRVVQLSTGYSAGAPGLFRVDANTSPFGEEDATPRSRALVHVHALLRRVGRAGLPGTLWCASHFFWPLLLVSLFARPPLGLGCPVCDFCCFLFSSFSSPCFVPRCSRLSVISGPWCPGPWLLVAPSSLLSFFFAPLCVAAPPLAFCGLPPRVPFASALCVCSPSLSPCAIFSAPPRLPLRSVVCVVLPLLLCCAVQWCTLSLVSCRGAGPLCERVALCAALLGCACSAGCFAHVVACVPCAFLRCCDESLLFCVAVIACSVVLSRIIPWLRVGVACGAACALLPPGPSLCGLSACLVLLRVVLCCQCSVLLLRVGEGCFVFVPPLWRCPLPCCRVLYCVLLCNAMYAY